RQVVSLAANPKSIFGSGVGGEGVQISDVGRKVDELIDRQLQLSNSESGRLDARDRFLDQIENVFNDLNGDGFASRLEKFFDSVSSAADNPANTVARAQVVSDAQSLTLQANKMYSRLTEMALPVDKEVTNQLSDLNSQLKNFRDINVQIVRANSAGTAPLDLLDQRQELLNKLSGMIDVQVLAGASGSMVLQTRSGQLLVDEKYVAQFSRNDRTTTTGFSGIGVDGQSFDFTSLVGGGTLKGLLEIRDQAINGSGGYLTRLESIVDEIRFQVNSIQSQSVASGMNTTQTGVMNLGGDLSTSIGSLVTDARSGKYQFFAWHPPLCHFHRSGPGRCHHGRRRFRPGPGRAFHR
ncbi:MAG: flagellar hook-associated protein FlgK, partial [Magnetococcus sp. DMHC-1]